MYLYLVFTTKSNLKLYVLVYTVYIYENFEAKKISKQILRDFFIFGIEMQVVCGPELNIDLRSR